MAAASGCDPRAVLLIACHQEQALPQTGDPDLECWLPLCGAPTMIVEMIGNHGR